jgi:hypothetical protein
MATMARSGAMQGVGQQNWEAIEHDLEAYGNAVMPGLLSTRQCVELAALYSQDQDYRARIVMVSDGGNTNIGRIRCRR